MKNRSLPFPCACGQRFRTKEEVDAHVRACATRIEPLTCPLCGHQKPRGCTCVHTCTGPGNHHVTWDGPVKMVGLDGKPLTVGPCVVHPHGLA